MRALFLSFVVWALAGCAVAQDLSGLARVDVAESGAKDGWFDQTRLTLALSQGVPFRVFLMDDPARLIADFREVDFSGVSSEDLLSETDRMSAIRFGTFKPGWSRFVVDLAEPMVPTEISMPIDPSSGRAVLSITLKSTTEDVFAEQAIGPIGADWVQQPAPRRPTVADGDFVVVIDPGHGGIDPGAVRGETTEKDLMLGIGLALRDTLRRHGDVEVIMTRDSDEFVSLPGRVAMAHQVEADAFLSFHADALSEGQARGATVYYLSDEASDAASAQLAAQHERADILAGVDLSGSDDEVAAVLMDLARTETRPRTRMLSVALVEQMTAAGGPMNKRPLRKAAFSVLKSADIPSVLIEIGFLSDDRDLANLRDPVWRARIVEALAAGLLQWRDDDLATRPLVRQ